MAWFVDGNSESLSLGISESGYQRINGTAINHKPFGLSPHETTEERRGRVFGTLSSFSEPEIELLKKLSGLEFVWSIVPTNAAESDTTDNNFQNPPSLDERCKSSPESSHVSFSYYDFRDDLESPVKDRVESVGAMIVLPPATFGRVWVLFHSVLLEPNLGYRICIEFSGFKVEGASSETLTSNEFL